MTQDYIISFTAEKWALFQKFRDDLDTRDTYETRNSKFLTHNLVANSLEYNLYSLKDSPYLQELYIQNPEDPNTFILKDKYKNQFHYQEGEQHYFFIGDNFYNLTKRIPLISDPCYVQHTPAQKPNLVLVVHPKELINQNGLSFNINPTTFGYRAIQAYNNNSLSIPNDDLTYDTNFVNTAANPNYSYIFCQDILTPTMLPDFNSGKQIVPFINLLGTFQLNMVLYFCAYACTNEKAEKKLKKAILDVIFK